MKPLLWLHVELFILDDISKLCLQQEGFVISLWRTTNSLGNSLWCLGGGSLWICWASNSTRYNPFWTGEVLHGGIKCQVMALSSLLYVIPFSFYSHMYTFKESSRGVGSHMAFQKAFSISCPFLYSLLYPALSFLSWFNSPILVSSLSLHSTYYIIFPVILEEFSSPLNQLVIQS